MWEADTGIDTQEKNRGLLQGRGGASRFVGNRGYTVPNLAWLGLLSRPRWNKSKMRATYRSPRVGHEVGERGGGGEKMRHDRVSSWEQISLSSYHCAVKHSEICIKLTLLPAHWR